MADLSQVRRVKSLLGDRVRMEMWLSELRNASAVMQFRFLTQREHWRLRVGRKDYSLITKPCAPNG